MRLPAVEKKARSLSIHNTWLYTKEELIRKIQQAEGNAACFKTGRKTCEQMACCWRPDCIR